MALLPKAASAERVAQIKGRRRFFMAMRGKTKTPSLKRLGVFVVGYGLLIERIGNDVIAQDLFDGIPLVGGEAKPGAAAEAFGMRASFLRT